MIPFLKVLLVTIPPIGTGYIDDTRADGNLPLKEPGNDSLSKGITSNNPTYRNWLY